MHEPKINQKAGSQAEATAARPKSAWQIACDAGLDMSLVELSLSKTPWERLQDHDQALALAQILQQAAQARHAPA